MKFDDIKVRYLLNELQEQRTLLLSDFYEYIDYNNLLTQKSYLRSITPLSFKLTHKDMDYYDVFFEISSGLDFISNFGLKEAIGIFLVINGVDLNHETLNIIL